LRLSHFRTTGRGLLRSSNIFFTNPKANDGRKQSGAGWRLFFLLSIIIAPILIGGCAHLDEGSNAREIFGEANDFFSRGDYKAALGRYGWIADEYPGARERALFEMGIIHMYPGNEQKDYQKSLECFQKLIKDYPESRYRRDSEMMVFQIGNVILKDRTIAAQQAQIDTSQQEVRAKRIEILALQKRIEALEQKVFALRREPVDRVLIEKKERRLTLLARGEVIKTYKIALGGNPSGPKERQGDNKTPEGVYVIDSRNRTSAYHLSLHISYPNEKDRKRARELGVSPGGDIMIHGLKNGYSWVGNSHAGADWTRGCIAVTDEEIEEIEKLVPDGTAVEIRP